MTLPIRIAWLFLLLGLATCGGGGGGGDGSGPPDPPFQPPDGEDQRLDTDLPGGQLSVFPEICGAGDRVYVTWYDRRDGDTDVYFSRSLDGGASWSASDVRLDTDPPGAAGSNIPRIACDGDTVCVVWSDQRGTFTEIRANRSLDAGATWLAADVRVDRAVPLDGPSWNPDVCMAGGVVYAVWQDARDGLSDVYFSRSLDGGQTWSVTDVRLDTDAAGAAMSEFPRIACDGQRVYVVWQDERDGEPDVRCNVSLDGGQSWLANDVRLDTDDPGAARSLQPLVACDGDGVGVVWSDDRDGERDIRFNGSSNAGAAWFLEDVRVETDAPGASASYVPVLHVSGSEVLVAWEDLRNGFSDVYVSRSTDGGAGWSFPDVKVDTDPPGTASALRPRIARGAGHVVLAWYDDREGAFDVLLSTSADGGMTWAEEETRLDTDPAGAAPSVAPVLCVSGGRVHAAWYDQRDGPGDIYANRVTLP